MAYVEATGTTHLLSGAAGLVAALLQDAGRPLDMAELCTAFGQFVAPIEHTEQAAHIGHDFSLQDVLGELQRIGLATMQGS